jgi:acid phosphatase type 7
MPPRASRLVNVAVVIWCALAASWCGGSTPSSPTRPTPAVALIPDAPVVIETPLNETPQATPPIVSPSGGTWVNIFGDTGWCGSPVMEPLARLLEQRGGDILLAGDLAYDNGTIEEFRRCFDPVFGRFRSRSWAVPGNHDYMTSGATGFFTYFGDRAGPTSAGYYALRIAGWQVLMLNSNVPMSRGSAQFTFVMNELNSTPSRCTLAVLHHPFDSSGPNGPNLLQRDLWELLHERGADVVVAAHDHFYERFAPQEPSNRSDPARGIRLFISGGGGAPPYQRVRHALRSELLISTHGVLRLKLDVALYEWEFVSVNGNVLDRGLNVCH